MLKLSNAMKPTPVNFVLIAAAIISLNTYLQTINIEAKWFMYSKMVMGAISAVLLVFTGKKEES